MGANVVITDINTHALEETLSTLDVQDGQEHMHFVADLTNEVQLEELVAAVPVLDGLVSNAGISKVLPIQFLNSLDMDKIMTINAFAPMLLTQKLYKKKKINHLRLIFLSF